MRPTLAFAGLTLLAAAAVTHAADTETLPPAPSGATWKLIWHDEFESGKLDDAKWHVPEYHRRDAEWSRDAIEVSDGKLIIKCFEKDGKYYDGCVRTHGRFEHAFGYYTARIKLQKSDGHWSAFWLMGRGVGNVGDEGRDGTEIDIMEKPKMDDKVHHNLHWDGYGEHHKSAGSVSTVPGILEGWHTFSLLWLPDVYVFYVDGKEVWRTTAGGVCQAPLFVKLSDEAAFGGWAGDVRKAKLPDQFEVDYVRVYDAVDAAGKPIYPRPEGSIGGLH